MYREYKDLDSLKGHEILIQRPVNKYYENPKICKHCNKVIKIRIGEKVSDVKNKTFCSHSCSSSFNNVLRNFVENKEKVIYTCSLCNNNTTKRRKYCNSCKDNLHRREEVTNLGSIIYDKHHKSASFAYVRDRAKSKLKKHRKELCEFCGYDNHVECAHIKPISSFSNESLLSEINSLNNLLWLCPNHHWELDFGKLTLADIIKSSFYHKS